MIIKSGTSIKINTSNVKLLSRILTGFVKIKVPTIQYKILNNFIKFIKISLTINDIPITHDHILLDEFMINYNNLTKIINDTIVYPIAVHHNMYIELINMFELINNQYKWNISIEIYFNSISYFALTEIIVDEIDHEITFIDSDQTIIDL